VIAAFHHHVAASIEPVMNVHAAPVVVEAGYVSIRPPGNGAIPALRDGVPMRGLHAMSRAGTAAVGCHVARMATGRIGPKVLPALRSSAV